MKVLTKSIAGVALALILAAGILTFGSSDGSESAVQAPRDRSEAELNLNKR